MKRPPLTFAASHAMAAAPDGTMPGVTLDDYARHALDRWQHFGEAIVAGAVAHLYRTGITPEQPQGMPRGRWLDMHMENDRFPGDITRHAPLVLAPPAGRDLDAEVVAGVQAGRDDLRGLAGKVDT